MRSHFCWSCCAVQHIVKLVSFISKSSLLGPNTQACVQCSTAILDRLNLLCAAFYLSTLLWFLTRPSVGHAANCSILENFSAPSSRVLSMWHYLVPICTVLLLSMQQVKAIHAVLNSTQWVDSSDFSMQLFTQPAQSCASQDLEIRSHFNVSVGRLQYAAAFCQTFQLCQELLT